MKTKMSASLRGSMLLLASYLLPIAPAHGQDFVWARAMGGTGVDGANGVAVDAGGNVYTAGVFQGTVDFDPGAGTFNLTAVGDFDIFVQKLDSDGNLVWARAMGGTGVDSANGVAVDASGNVYTAGSFQDTVDFDPGAGVVNLTSAGGNDIFVQKLDSAGNFVWARAMGGTRSDRANAVAVDGSGNVYTAGSFQGTADFDPGPGTVNRDALCSLGFDRVEAFVLKLDSAGNLVWVGHMGGQPADPHDCSAVAVGVAVDASGNVHTAGSYFGGDGFNDALDFDPGPGVFRLPSFNTDMFVQKLDTLGNFVWVRSIDLSFVSEAIFDDEGRAVAVDGSGNVYALVSQFRFGFLDPGGLFQVHKFDSAGNSVWISTAFGTDLNPIVTRLQGRAVAVDGSGNVYTAGAFAGTGNLTFQGTEVNLPYAGNREIFVVKLDGAGDPVWARAMGGTGSDEARGVAVDGSGNVYSAGFFEGTADFDPGPGAGEVFNLISAGLDDIFVSKLGPPDSDNDGVPDGDDLCPGTTIPESLPSADLRRNRWALVTNDFDFDTNTGGGGGPNRAYTTSDTGGCSCEQIAVQLGLGGGHTKYGCSTSVMDQWVALVAAQ